MKRLSTLGLSAMLVLSFNGFQPVMGATTAVEPWTVLGRVSSQKGDAPRNGADWRLGEGRILLAQSRKELGQNLANNTVRMDQMQEQIRDLTGKIEQLVFENQRLQEQIRLMQEDTEARLQELENGKRSDLGVPNKTKHAATTPPSSPVATSGDPVAGLIGRSAEGVAAPAAVSPSSGAPAQEPLDLGAAIQHSSLNGGLPESRDPLLQPNGVASLGTLAVVPASDPEALYNLGYTQLLNGDYAAAEASLQQFVERYPNHTLTANARYWLGETFYVRGQFSDAVAEFSQSYKSFPGSEKAPDSLLKLGLSLSRLDERDAACATLAEMLTRFPNASRSIQIAAHDEQVRANCS